MPITMCSACMPVSAKYSTMNMRIWLATGASSPSTWNQPCIGKSRIIALAWCAWCSSSFDEYSKSLITRNTKPSTIVAPRYHRICRCLPSCAECTAIATVSDEAMSTAVLMPPSIRSSSRLAAV